MAMAFASDRPDGGSIEEEETWLLQSAAAAEAGCSVSAIRKWRRSGLVADRTRLTAGGMSRVEVRLEDVLRRAEESMPGRRAAASPVPVAVPVVTAPQVPVETPVAASAPPAPFTPVAVISVTELDSFVKLVGDAERRAAQAEARLQANGVMMQFLRDRAEELQRRVDGQPVRMTEPESALQRLEDEIRRLRSYVARGGGGSAPGERAALRASYDAALVCAAFCLGLRSPFRLGDPLTAGDRASLTEALAASGFTVT